MVKVGLLEDNLRIAKLSATMLAYAGHEVSVYEHAHECLRALKLSPEQPNTQRQPVPITFEDPPPIDVLILDLHLPDMNGFEIIRRLRSHPHTKDIPLIFCSAATITEISNAMSLVPKAIFLEKPFTYQALVAVISKVLQQPTNPTHLSQDTKKSDPY
jgi:CheY-like chemotaxis protein